MFSLGVKLFHKLTIFCVQSFPLKQLSTLRSDGITQCYKTGRYYYSYYFENSKVTVTVKNLKPKTMQKKKMTSPLLTEIIADIREKADKNI